MSYLKGFGAFLVAVTIITNISNQAFSVYSNTWLSEWSEDTNSTQPHVRDMYLGVYGALGVLQCKDSRLYIYCHSSFFHLQSYTISCFGNWNGYGDGYWLRKRCPKFAQ